MNSSKSIRGLKLLLGENGLLKTLTKGLIERALQAELSHHLQYPSPEPEPLGSPPEEQPPRRNSRNGFSKKTVQADFGQVEIQIPRDRLSEFEPILVKKGQHRLAGLDEKVIAGSPKAVRTHCSGE